MRLIDADAFVEEMQLICRGAKWDRRDIRFSLADIEFHAKTMPTVDVEPVRHGHWELVRNPMMYQTVPYVQVCSQCGAAFPYKMPYCGECGAKMDEVIDE